MALTPKTRLDTYEIVGHLRSLHGDPRWRPFLSKVEFAS